MAGIRFWQQRWFKKAAGAVVGSARQLPTRRLLVEMLEERTLPSASYLPGEILVQFKPGASAIARAEARGAVQGALADSIRATAMAGVGQGGLECISLNADVSVEQALKLLENNPNIQYAEPNWVYSSQAVSNDPYYTTSSRLWGMYSDDSPTSVGPAGTTNQFGSQAEEAWNAGYLGSSDVYVGIIDEGFQYSHPDLDANSWTNPFDPLDGIDNDGNGKIDDIHGWDFFSNDNSTYDGTADDHGTHVAGTIGGEGGNGLGVAGVNWNVKMISAKFLGPTGGTTAGAILALDYLTDLKVRHGLNIVATNNSWGGGGFSQGLLDAITRAANQGILFIAAAGNSNSNNDATASYPSNYSTVAGAGYEAVIAVASINSSGAKSSFSSYGATTVDLGAPGEGIYSTLPTDTYGSYSGTSMATPHVTGAAALYAAAHPTASAAQIRSAILNSVTPTTSLNGITATGGRLNISALMGEAPAPSLSINDVSIAEGNGGTQVLTFTVTLANPPAAQTVTVDYATANGTASAGSDYVAIATQTLSFAPGTTTQTVNVTINGDIVGEANETFFVNLSGATNASIADSQGQGTITNDDLPAMSINDPSITEGARGKKQLRFTVSLSSPATQTVSVQYSTANGSATAPSDYKAVTGTAVISAGLSSTTISITIFGDRTVEPNETFFVNLSNAAGATLIDAQGVGTILNDDGGAAGSGGSSAQSSPVLAIDVVISKVSDLDLSRGQVNSLVVKLEAAKRAVLRDNLKAAASQLHATVNALLAFKRSGRLDDLVADALSEEISDIVSLLNG